MPSPHLFPAPLPLLPPFMSSALTVFTNCSAILCPLVSLFLQFTLSAFLLATTGGGIDQRTTLGVGSYSVAIGFAIFLLGVILMCLAKGGRNGMVGKIGLGVMAVRCFLSIRCSEKV